MPERNGPVLVASDLQASSRPIVQFAAGLAHAAEAPLVLLHVVESKAVEHIRRRDRESHLSKRRADSEQALKLQASDVTKPGRPVIADLVVNRPAHEAILERVEDTGAGIVIVGSGAREGRGSRLSSTADRLLRSSPVPCLIVRGQGEFPVTKAAAATDFSSRARGAIRAAARWLDPLGEGRMHLDLLHATYRSYLNVDPSLKVFLEKNLDKEVNRLGGGSGAARTGTRLCVGSHPVDGLIRAAKQERYQLLVTGTHGHGRVRRALVGSVAMGLAQSAPCPVLVIPPRASR